MYRTNLIITITQTSYSTTTRNKIVSSKELDHNTIVETVVKLFPEYFEAGENEHGYPQLKVINEKVRDYEIIF